MTDQIKTKRYSLASRLSAMTGFTTILVVGLTWWPADSCLFIGAEAMVAPDGWAGPVVVEGGGGFIEFFSSLLELMAEAMRMALAPVGSIFAGFG